MTNQNFTGLFQSDFNPSHKTIKKSKSKIVKKVRKIPSKNKAKNQQQYIATVSK